ncbi:3-deoxy-7-phosphoheptulonate synthase [Shewanella xiamenensis]|uniref:3-deoxy-7-phosphoheptulonate synthase n=1 Tax=Shewanella xiamenensis TaxID=332186 RepID=UPI0011868094|nr:3-deoxy-7-phosphoheptulonate synthase [Shewanella xiamenensis]TVL12281.1 3-deoxy-7-phosphoheptulonate synthase [Shewanella xiamenensis]TVL12630.1 3-deoxy-7-phosphoheptulonate synthase [Shewanella xiamenensis]TVL20185.1 3-deoxy-7-phosphoheptulonate synthase [Shewanella xiamenensis]TVL25756.1 3-deoxy-7-phosphoheptulonate synthase [Shewanella xiamenensis]TVO94935.1 3-deoxy-7-phosphoheptulonate synthase [Shewanella xiamenensis]
MTIKTDELRTSLLAKVISPAQLASEYPLTQDAADYLVQQRREVEAIIMDEDHRLLVIIGPCSIHDTQAALDYARRLAVLHQELKDDLCILMRVYFEKPRTIVGWKGLISDPDLDGSFEPNKGLRIARQLLQQITELKLPIATEFLDMVNGQYIADLITWGAIGARTTESQVHREMASALSCPVGFKNGTDGNINIAVDAVRAAKVPHIFYSPDKDGAMSVYRTHGNPYGHIILRGGKKPNYFEQDIEQARLKLESVNVTPRVVVDFSHGNSEKNHLKQLVVAENIMAQMRTGSTAIAGIMAESFLQEGNQKVIEGQPLCYGQSITDACLHWDDSEKLLRDLAKASRDRRELLGK